MPAKEAICLRGGAGYLQSLTLGSGKGLLAQYVLFPTHCFQNQVVMKRGGNAAVHQVHLRVVDQLGGILVRRNSGKVDWLAVILVPDIANNRAPVALDLAIVDVGKEILSPHQNGSDRIQSGRFP